MNWLGWQKLIMSCSSFYNNVMLNETNIIDDMLVTECHILPLSQLGWKECWKGYNYLVSQKKCSCPSYIYHLRTRDHSRCVKMNQQMNNQTRPTKGIHYLIFSSSSVIVSQSLRQKLCSVYLFSTLWFLHFFEILKYLLFTNNSTIIVQTTFYLKSIGRSDRIFPRVSSRIERLQAVLKF